jgi:hypothetical protein
MTRQALHGGLHAPGSLLKMFTYVGKLFALASRSRGANRIETDAEGEAKLLSQCGR